VPGATRRRHRVVPPEEYYPLLLGHRLTGLSVLLHVDRRDNDRSRSWSASVTRPISRRRRASTSSGRSTVGWLSVPKISFAVSYSSPGRNATSPYSTQHVPLPFRAIPYSRLPTMQRERVEAYPRSRAPDLTAKILDPGWKPALRRRRAVPGPALSQPAVVGALRWQPVSVAAADSAPQTEPEPTTPPSAPASASSRKEAAPSPATRTFAQIHAELSADIIGREDLVNDLAMSVYLHAQGISSRLPLTGPSGSGKTFAATAMARAAGVPVAVVSATDIVETGYRGLNVGDLLRPLYEAAGSLERMATAALVVDELGKLRMPAMLADTVGYQKRRGQQESLLGLIGGGTPVHFHTDGGHKEIDTSKMLIVLTDAFADCDWTGRRPPTTGDLIRAGIIPELADRVGQSIQLPPRSVQDLVALFKAPRDGLLPIRETYAKLGYTLEIADAAYGMVAYAVASEGSGIGPRSGMTLLVQAARRRLIPLLRSGAPAGTTVVITPDDVQMPPPGGEEADDSWR
jgi:hypothetical protein